MIVEFKMGGYGSTVVYGCPGKPYKTIIVYDIQKYKYRDVNYHENDILFETYEYPDYLDCPDDPDIYTLEKFTQQGISKHIDEFIHPHNDSRLTENLWKFFMTLLGFVPFGNPLKGASKYIPGPIFHSAEEVRNRVRPVVYHMFMEIKIPMALIKQMGTLTGIYDNVGEFPDSIIFPPHLEPYVQQALIKLATQKAPWITIDDILVYDFLGFVDVITNRKPMFIDGDELVEFTAANLLHAGYFSAEPGYAKLYFVYYPKRTDVGVPDTFLEMLEPYEAIKNIVEE